MDDEKLRELTDALALTLWAIVAGRMADAADTATGRAAQEQSAASEAAAACSRTASLVAAAALAGLMADCRSSRRRMARDARRHGEEVAAEPSARVERASFTDLVAPIADPGNVLIEGYDGEWREYAEAMRDYVERAASDPSRPLDEMVAEVAKRASEDGVRVRAGASGAMELTGYVRMRVIDRSGRLADADRWGAAPPGMDHVELSAHDLCADDHLPWQGRVLSVAEWNRANASMRRPIGTHSMNCRHIAFPCYGDTEPVYDKRALEERGAESTREVTYTGRGGERRTCTAYEATQLMRARERSVRKLRSEAAVLRAGGQTAKADAAENAADRAVTGYREFCREVGMRPEASRLRVYTLDAGMAPPASAGVAAREARAGFRKLRADETRAVAAKAVNPGYATGRWGYTHNCQRCVPTYEMRRRGYDVVARPAPADEESDVVLARWRSVFRGARWEKCPGNGRDRVLELMEEWGEGSRAEVYVKWAGRGSAHVFVAEKTRTGVVFLDPQSGRISAGNSFERAEPGSVMVARIDNLEPSGLIEQCCKSRKGGSA